MDLPEKDISHYAFVDREGRMFNRRVCLVKQGARIPGHTCFGANRVLDFDGFFNIRDLFALVERLQLQPQTLAFDDIWHQINGPGEKEWILDNDPRYGKADPGFPGIVSPIRNPDNKPYRMLDGRRRMWKQQAGGATEGQFYVLPEPEVYDCFWLVMSQERLAQQVAPSRQG